MCFLVITAAVILANTAAALWSLLLLHFGQYYRCALVILASVFFITAAEV